MLAFARLRAPLVIALIASQAGCAGGLWSTKYLLQQGAGQLALLRSRQRVSDVLIDPNVNEATRAKLRLAMEARNFGVHVLGLRGADAFTRFIDTRGAPIAWNVQAAPKDKLVPWLNRFPIVGAVPYLGFFREADARREEARLRAKGLDTWVREVAGYSTLGLTADPIYSSMIEGSDASIVEVVLHEMLHGTVYVAGQSSWNESLATLVGLRGAAAFFAARGTGDETRELYEQAAKRERRSAEFSSFLEPILAELETLYASPVTRDEKLRLRELIFTRAQAAYRERFAPAAGRPLPSFLDGPLSNAKLVGYAVYHRAAPDHERLLARLGGDLPAFIRLCKHAVEEHRDPLAYLRGFLR